MYVAHIANTEISIARLMGEVRADVERSVERDLDRSRVSRRAGSCALFG